MSNGIIKVEEELIKLQDELDAKKVERYNKIVLAECLEAWCENIRHNHIISNWAKSIEDLPKSDKKYATVVGAAPDLKDEEIERLKEANCDIIVTNKNYRRFLELGIEPQICCLLDYRASSVMPFRFLIDEEIATKTCFVASVTCYPWTLDIMYQAGRGRLYLFTPEEAYEADGIRLSKVFSLISRKPTMEHGGNVGTLATNLAMERYEEIALMGFGMFDRPEDVLTMEEAGQRVWFYYPDEKRFIGIPDNFMAYYAYLSQRTMEYNDRGGVVWNLNSGPNFRHNPVFKQGDIDEWIEHTKR